MSSLQVEAVATVLVAVDSNSTSLRALEWALDHLATGPNPLSVHLVHVVRTLAAQLEVYTGCGPGTGYNFAEFSTHHEIADVEIGKKFLHEQVVPLIDKRGLQHELHLFVETASCPPQAILDVIQKVALQINPVAVVLGCNNKGTADLALGPVAKLCQTRLGFPVALIR